MIKYLDGSYKHQIRELWESTFTEDGPDFVDHYFNVFKDMSEVMGILEDETLVAMLHLNPYQIMWDGRLYNTTYVVGVATDVKYRRKGYMRQILRHMLVDRFKRGDVLQLLMPIDSRYYEQFGYGFVQDVILYHFTYKNLLREPRQVVAKVLEPEDGVDLMGLYNQYKKQFNLSHNRGLRSFELLMSEVKSEKGHVVMVPDGYVIYYDHESVFVREAAYISQEGLANILDHIGQYAKDKRILWQAPIHDPIKHMIPHLEGHERTQKPFMMMRVINVQVFLSHMSHLLEGMVIKVIDDDILENNRTFLIEGGTVGVTDRPPHVTLDSLTLVQWLFGYDELEKLAYTRPRVKIHQELMMDVGPSVTNYFNEFV